MAEYTVTSTLRESNGRKFYVRGSSVTSMADARLEHNTRLAVTVGTLVGQKETTVPTTPDGDVHIDGEYSDAVLIVRRNLGSGVFGPRKAIKLQNISNAYALAGSDGSIDIAGGDIIAIAANHEDGEGNRDYVAVDGFYVA
jgi:hypothetical protein